MQTEDFYMILGELYVAQRTMRHERDKLEEQLTTAKLEIASLNERLDKKEAGNED